jgi:hypothetical protein
MSQSRIGRRIICLESSESLMIEISAPKRIDFLTILLTLFGLWGFILYTQLRIGIDFGFAVCWVGIILFPLLAWMWGAIGREIITINNSKIMIKQTIFGVGFRQTYQLAQVNNLRRSLTDPDMFTFEKNMQGWGFAGGSIAFDYQGRVCRFGLILSKEDADVLATKINQYLATSANSLSSSTVKA